MKIYPYVIAIISMSIQATAQTVSFKKQIAPIFAASCNACHSGPNAQSGLNISTYAALSMRDGDAFAKKFGGPTGNDPDFFRVTVRGFDALGTLTGSVEFFLADYRFTNNAQDYIVSQWTTLSLTPLGNAAKLTFALDSTDNGPFGMNTPAYFALVMFGYAASLGLISIATILASLYPIVTVLLAHLFVGERLRGFQLAGVALALGGVALVSAS